MHDPWVIGNDHLILRLLLSVLLGALIGFERERKNHAAGLRTHTLVCLGSCLIMILSIYGFADFADEPNVRLDPARLAAQVITGIGFLGAGTILFTGKAITGLTTAASVWVVMAMGLAVGAGFYIPAAVSAIMVFLILWGLNIVEKRYVKHRRECTITVSLNGGSQRVDEFQRLLANRGAKLLKIQFAGAEEPIESIKTDSRRIQFTIMLPQRENLIGIAEDFHRVEGVNSVVAE